MNSLRSPLDFFNPVFLFDVSKMGFTSYKYGFILRYGKDMEYITGYNYEPWHYRYVGLEAAKIIYEEELTLEEYYYYYVKK